MKYLILIILICGSISLFSQDKGIITGTVTDKETQKPLSDVTVAIIGREKHTAADSLGKFEFKNLAYGNYQLKFSAIGYESIVKTDIVVLSSRPTNINVQLNSEN